MVALVEELEQDEPEILESDGLDGGPMGKRE
jgi:hypothetical protein